LHPEIKKAMGIALGAVPKGTGMSTSLSLKGVMVHNSRSYSTSRLFMNLHGGSSWTNKESLATRARTQHFI
jgi:hypothetical protein